MPPPSAVFWDVGGVILSNAWDHEQRRAVLDALGVGPVEFEPRHEREVEAFETGRLSLKDYLDATLFLRRRPFSRQRVESLMKSRSTAHPTALALARRLRRRGRCLCATLNNESRELNEYRIAHFKLRGAFDAFFSSCYLGARKPDAAIYLKALELSQRAPRECLFIDDREENLVVPKRLGLRVHHFRDAGALEGVLRGLRLL